MLRQAFLGALIAGLPVAYGQGHGSGGGRPIETTTATVATLSSSSSSIAASTASDGGATSSISSATLSSSISNDDGKYHARDESADAMLTWTSCYRYRYPHRAVLCGFFSNANYSHSFRCHDFYCTLVWKSLAEHTYVCSRKRVGDVHRKP